MLCDACVLLIFFFLLLLVFVMHCSRLAGERQTFDYKARALLVQQAFSNESAQCLVSDLLQPIRPSWEGACQRERQDWFVTWVWPGR